jgi:hypothetical protein
LTQIYKFSVSSETVIEKKLLALLFDRPVRSGQSGTGGRRRLLKNRCVIFDSRRCARELHKFFKIWPVRRSGQSLTNQKTEPCFNQIKKIGCSVNKKSKTKKETEN